MYIGSCIFYIRDLGLQFIINPGEKAMSIDKDNLLKLFFFIITYGDY